MGAPALADLVAVGVGVLWLRSAEKRSKLRDTMERLRIEKPEQYDLVRRIIGDSLARLEAGESPMVPLALGAYAVLRLKGRSCR